MALARWEPRNLPDLRGEIDNLFDRFWKREGNGLTSGWYPTVDVVEREDTYVVTADLPGLKREDIKVQMVNNMLTISGERASEHKDETHRWTERSYGSFSRSFTLPASVDGEHISAQYKDGVLTVTVPKSEEAKAKQIQIR